MATNPKHGHGRWANLRFSIVGVLLAAPPRRGELRAALEELAARTWTHPITGAPVIFAFSTIERWLHVARGERTDTVGALRRRVRHDAGKRRSLGALLVVEVLTQHREHPGWSYQLHADNLVALGAIDPTLGRVPSYSTVRRFMKERGLFRQKPKRWRRGDRPSDTRARERFESRETRSYEHEYVLGLWHLDFHTASRKVLSSTGELLTPVILAVLDDRSRLCCHLQWYFAETAENLVHAVSQAIQKRGLPGSLLSDNGGAMTADETREGFARLGVIHETTLPASPQQNGKQEVFWSQVEGRLLAMLETVPDLRLDALNHATQAWVEMEYNRARHSEIRETPTERFLRGPTVGRPSPTTETLRHAFRLEQTRTQRRSDGTVSIEGVRFEVPARYRHLERLSVRYARWDLSRVHLVDARMGTLLAPLYPLDRAKNASGIRRHMGPVASVPADETAPATPKKTGMAPLLRQLIDAYDRSGLPPAYLPKHDDEPQHDDEPRPDAIADTTNAMENS